MATLCSQNAGQLMKASVDSIVMETEKSQGIFSSKTQIELRKILNETFLVRCERNSRYSLRAYAKSIGIDPTLLSRLMKGERAFSKQMIERLCRELDLPLNKSSRLLKPSTESKANSKTLSDSSFSCISKWYFFAILDLFLLKDFKSEPYWIAEKIGLSVTETNAALQILIEQGHIESRNNKLFIRSQSTTWSNHKTTSRERISYQKQLLDCGKMALDDVDFEERENASLTLAASSKLIPEIKIKIQKFKDELREFIEANEDYDSVYQLVISYFPLTR